MNRFYFFSRILLGVMIFFSTQTVAQTSFGLESLFFNTSNVDSIITDEIADTLPTGKDKIELSQLARFTYDAQCRETRQTDFLRDTAAKIWVADRRINTTYDATSRKMQMLTQVAVSRDSFIDAERVTNAYTGTSRTPSKMTRQTATGGGFINQNETDLTYTTANLVETAIAKVWTGAAFVNDERTTFTYSTTNRVTSKVVELWNRDSTRWMRSTREMYRYNTQNLVDSITTEEWKTNAWIVNGGAKFDIRNNGLVISTTTANLKSELKGLFFALNFVGRADKRLDSLTIRVVDADSKQGFLTTRQKFIYNEACIKTSTSEAVNTEGVARITPNPASDNLTIELTGKAEPNMTATIFNSVGQAVKSFKINDLEQINIDVNDLQSGFYIMNLTGRKVRTVQKFVISR